MKKRHNELPVPQEASALRATINASRERASSSVVRSALAHLGLIESADLKLLLATKVGHVDPTRIGRLLEAVGGIASPSIVQCATTKQHSICLKASTASAASQRIAQRTPLTLFTS